ncbi:hypothetical protein ES708_34494 [subsurface metagenome]
MSYVLTEQGFRNLGIGTAFGITFVFPLFEGIQFNKASSTCLLTQTMFE